MKPVTILILCILLSINIAYSQSIDSLANLIKNETNDHKKIDLMSELIEAYNKQDSNLYEQTGEEAIKLALKINDTKKTAEILDQLGFIYTKRNNHPKAIGFYKRGLKYASKINNDSLQSVFYNSIGYEFLSQGKYTKALKKYQKALDISERIKDSTGISMGANNIANIYSDIEQYDKAVEYYNIAMANFGKKQDLEGKNIVLNNLATIYIEKYNKIDSAIIYLEKSLKISEQINDKEGITWAYLSIGFAYTNKKDYKKAIKYTLKAKELSSKINVQELNHQISLDLGHIYSMQNNYDSSYFYLNRALEIVKKTNSILLLEEVYQELSKVTFKHKKYKLSCIYKDSLLVYKDSVNQMDIEKEITEIGTKYETDKIQKENKIQKLKIEQQKQSAHNQNIVIYSLSIIVALILIFSIIILKQFRDKTKINYELKLQHEEILQKNEEINAQNEEILSQRDILLNKNKNINDSITYASRIQNAILGNTLEITQNLQNAFIYFRPHGIVSGDFYLFRKIEKEGEIYNVIIAGDCTGHGVPGAFMTIMGHGLLTDIIVEEKIIEPKIILEKLNEGVLNKLLNKNEQVNDGMDISILVVNHAKKTATFSGAKNPLCLVRNNQLHVTKGTKCSIGDNRLKNKEFEQHNFELKNNDMFYLYSDGFQDQFGGKNGKKYMSQKFRKFLLSGSSKTCKEQHKNIDEEFIKWKGNQNQTDDVLIFGYRFLE